MANSSIQIPKAHIIMALCLPLAVLLGYVLAEPLESGSLAVVVFVLVILSVPLMMKWHHPLLILSWNASINPFFLPGRASLWIVLAAGSMLIAVLNRATNPNEKFIIVPSITKAMILLALVVVITAFFAGGFGLRMLGSSQQGGKKYFYLLGAILGYFALTTKRIPANRAGLYVVMFFLPGVIAAISNLAYFGGPAFYFLFSMFSPEFAQDQATAAVSMDPGIARISGLSWLCPAVYSCLLAKFGIRGLFDLSKPWRLCVFVLSLVAGLYGGFRSVVVMFALTFAILFFIEGLHRTRYLFFFGAVGVLSVALLVPFAIKLPLAAQRTLSVLPVRIDAVARQSAEASNEWRLGMWKAALPEIPKYLFRGKGYTLGAREMESIEDYSRMPGAQQWSGALTVGDFHNGPLSLLIPFGLWGAMAFMWFLFVSLRFMYRNFRFGDPNLRSINALLLATFAARIVFFFFVFGSFYSDMAIFAGLLGLSVSLNGAQPEPETAEDQDPALAELESGFNQA